MYLSLRQWQRRWSLRQTTRVKLRGLLRTFLLRAWLLPVLVKDELFTDDVKFGLLRPLYLLTLGTVVLSASGAR